ncbi:TetR/AcrR family transcriptional regulator [Kribbella sp. DT2]|uniref:TetR/AcrR family transcriptional regulator n=1 Tax=Kribbella sp. DT2 TaxID=3393427 RepID=UPI003CF0170D
MPAASEARRPGPARSLSRELILETALEIMATDGLDAVSFRSVSKAFGVNPMALYTYLKDKNELLAGMYDTAMRRIEPPPAKSRATAENQLVAYFGAVRQTLIENADLYRLARPIGVPGADLDVAERIAALFDRLGLPAAAAVETQLSLIQYTIGNALFYASLDADALASSMREAFADVDPDVHPRLHQLREVEAITAPAAAYEATVRSMIRSAVANHGRDL